MSQAEQAIWDSNKSSAACTLCKKPFSLVSRRHHCRHCGKLVCHTCSSKKLLLPAGPDASPSVPVRVCDPCYFVLTVKEEKKQQAEQHHLYQQELLTVSSFLSTTLCNVFFLDGTTKTICYDESTLVKDISQELWPYFPVALLVCTQDIHNPQHFLVPSPTEPVLSLLQSTLKSYPYAKLVFPVYDKGHLRMIQKAYLPISTIDTPSLHRLAFQGLGMGIVDAAENPDKSEEDGSGVRGRVESRVSMRARVGSGGVEIAPADKRRDEGDGSDKAKDAMALKTEIDSLRLELFKTQQKMNMYKALLSTRPAAAASTPSSFPNADDDTMSVLGDERSSIIDVSSSSAMPAPPPERRGSKIFSLLKRGSSKKWGESFALSTAPSTPTANSTTSHSVPPPPLSLSPPAFEEPVVAGGSIAVEGGSQHHLTHLLSGLGLTSTDSAPPIPLAPSFVPTPLEEKMLAHPHLFFQDVQKEDSDQNAGDAATASVVEESSEVDMFVRLFFHQVRNLEVWLSRYATFFSSAMVLSPNYLVPIDELACPSTERSSRSLTQLFYMVGALDGVHRAILENGEGWRGGAATWLGGLLSRLLALPLPADKSLVKLACAYFLSAKGAEGVGEGVAEVKNMLRVMVEGSVMKGVGASSPLPSLASFIHRLTASGSPSSLSAATVTQLLQNLLSTHASLLALQGGGSQWRDVLPAPLAAYPQEIFQEAVGVVLKGLLQPFFKAISKKGIAVGAGSTPAGGEEGAVPAALTVSLPLPQLVCLVQLYTPLLRLASNVLSSSSSALETLRFQKLELLRLAGVQVRAGVGEKVGVYRSPAASVHMYVSLGVQDDQGQEVDKDGVKEGERSEKDPEKSNKPTAASSKGNNGEGVVKTYASLLQDLENSSGSVLEAYTPASTKTGGGSKSDSTNALQQLPANLTPLFLAQAEAMLLTHWPLDLCEYVASTMRGIVRGNAGDVSGADGSAGKEAEESRRKGDIRVALLVQFFESLAPELSQLYAEQISSILSVGAGGESQWVRLTTQCNNHLLALSYLSKLHSYFEMHILSVLAGVEGQGGGVLEELDMLREKYFLLLSCQLEGVFLCLEGFIKILQVDMKKIVEKTFFTATWEDTIEGMVTLKKKLKSRLLFLKTVFVCPDIPLPTRNSGNTELGMGVGVDGVWLCVFHLLHSLHAKYSLPVPDINTIFSSPPQDTPPFLHPLLTLLLAQVLEGAVRVYVEGVLGAYGGGYAHYSGTPQPPPSPTRMPAESLSRENSLKDGAVLALPSHLHSVLSVYTPRLAGAGAGVSNVATATAGVGGVLGSMLTGSKGFQPISMTVINRLNEDLQLLLSLCEDLRYLLLVIPLPSQGTGSGTGGSGEHYDQVRRISSQTRSFFRRPLPRATVDAGNSSSSKSGKKGTDTDDSATPSLLPTPGYSSKLLVDRILQPLQHFIYACQMNKQYLPAFTRETLTADFGFIPARKMYTFLLHWRGETVESIKGDFQLHFQQLNSDEDGGDSGAAGVVPLPILYHIKSGNIVKM
eukprot:gene24224-29294_t